MLEKIREALGLMTIPLETLRTKRKRPIWNHIFLLEALIWSYKSHDAETQCGCVLVKNNTVIGTGYNGYISDINDEVLPNLRPFKYPFFIHAEHNAILNCVKNGTSTLNAIAYITAEPCNICLQYMWQSGIRKVIYTNFSQPNMTQNKEHQQIRKTLEILMDNRMEIIFIPFDQIEFDIIIDIYKKFIEKRIG